MNRHFTLKTWGCWWELKALDHPTELGDPTDHPKWLAEKIWLVRWRCLEWNPKIRAVTWAFFHGHVWLPDGDQQYKGPVNRDFRSCKWDLTWLNPKKYAGLFQDSKIQRGKLGRWRGNVVNFPLQKWLVVGIICLWWAGATLYNGDMLGIQLCKPLAVMSVSILDGLGWCYLEPASRIRLP